MPTTWNPSDLSNTTLSNGNLTATASAANSGVRSVALVTTGKYYFELTFVASSTQNVLGIANASAVLAGASNIANTGTSGAVVNSAGGMAVNGTSQGSLGSFAAGAACGIALDMGAGQIWFRNATTAGNWNASGAANPATGVGGFPLSTLTGGASALYAVSSVATLAGSTAITANFGGSAFVGAVPSGFTAGFGPPTQAQATQVALEQWAMPNAQAQLTQVALEAWQSVGVTAIKSGTYTYVVSGSRAGLSGAVAETRTRTYAVAMPAVLTESYVAPVIPSTQGARVMVLA